MRREIEIVGGGIAGLTLGILLREQGIPVTVHEAGTYPRHKVCGEFICGRGLEVLKALSLDGLALEDTAVRATTAAFHNSRAAGTVRQLTMPALSISRYTLDAALAQRFQASGGWLATQSRRPGPCGEGTVRASGRLPTSRAGNWLWYGLKAHATGIDPRADLEMHALTNGYVGLTRLPHGEVNVCGLFRRRREEPPPPEPYQLLRGPPGTRLHLTLGSAQFKEESRCAVSGLPIGKRDWESAEARIGDTLTMTPPVTGNGMSMAFESAHMAAAPIAEYAGGRLSWSETREQILSGARQRFSQRLRWADWLNGLMFAPWLQGPFGVVALRSGLLWNLLFARTR